MPAVREAELAGALKRGGSAVRGVLIYGGLVLSFSPLRGKLPLSWPVLAALLLNRVHLEPGEAIALPAGNLHSYLSGVGLEVMANSDNVLRGGLTPKHVDVPELLRILDFHPVTAAELSPETIREGTELRYATPAPEFAVSVFDIDGAALGGEIDAPCRNDGPQILVCTAGAVTVRSKTQTLELARGAAAWVAADGGPLRLRADEPAQLFRATVGI